MKRILALLLCAVMLFSLIACSSGLHETKTEEALTEEVNTKKSEEEKTEDKDPITLPEGYSAGFARVTLNPEQGTFLGGFTDGNRRSAEILDDIKYTCTALSNGTDVFLIFSSDTLYVSDSILDQVAKLADRNFKIPAENIIFNATHTHSAPAIHVGGAAQIGQYLKKLYPLLTQAMEDALRDLAPAELYIGETRTQNLNYVRRYTTLDGKTYLGGTSMEKKSITEARHETEVDNQMQVIRFVRKDKKDIVLCNWQCHTTNVGSEMGGTVSADWVAPLRETVEKDGDILFAYQQGAAGNVVPNSRLIEEKSNKDLQKHGEEIAAAVKEALNNAKKANWGKFQAKRIDFVGTHSDAYKKKAGVTADTDSMYLNALSIGDVAFGTTPCELHDTLGMYVKEKSPFAMTFMCAYSNGVVSYVPTEAAYDNGGYEANMFHFVRGTGEQMVEEVVKLLQEQYNNK